MADEILTYDEGNTALLTMQFTDSKGNPITTGTVTFRWKPMGQIPAAALTTWTAGVDPQIDTTAQAQGIYTAKLPLPVTNGKSQQRYECRWENDLNVTDTGSHPFVIVVSAKNV